jgi:predicted MFS family arabinose efflux permease
VNLLLVKAGLRQFSCARTIVAHIMRGMESTAAMAHKRRYKWVVVGLFWCVYFLNQADRQVVFSVFPLLQREFGLTNTELGLLGSCFQWVYGILVPIAGGLGDVLSRRNLIAVALLVWSAATFGSALASGFAVLLILRALTGAGEAFYYPAATSLIADYHPERTRATAMAIHQTSVYVGIVTSGALAGYVGEHYGWRTAFLSFGAVGILFTAIVRRGIREPVRGAAESTAGVGMPLSMRLAEVYRNRTAIAMTFAFLCMNFVNVACLAWTPTLVYERFHLSLAQAGLHATLYHHVGAAAGVLLGGRLADHLSQRSRISRPLIQLAGLVLATPFIFLLGWSGSQTIVFTSMGLFGLFRGFYDSNLFASLYEVVRPQARATATGIMLAVGFLGGGSSALVVGWMSRRVGLGAALSATSACYVAAAALMAAICLWWFRRDAIHCQ